MPPELSNHIRLTLHIRSCPHLKRQLKYGHPMTEQATVSTGRLLTSAGAMREIALPSDALRIKLNLMPLHCGCLLVGS